MSKQKREINVQIEKGSKSPNRIGKKVQTKIGKSKSELKNEK